MQTTLGVIRELWGSTRGYLSEYIGLSDDDLEGLKRTLLVDLNTLWKDSDPASRTKGMLYPYNGVSVTCYVDPLLQKL